MSQETVRLLFLVASIVGAAIFLAAGYLLCALRSGVTRPANGMVEREGNPLEAREAALASELDRARQSASNVERQCVDLADKVRLAHLAADQHEAEGRKLAEQVSRLQRELVEANTAAQVAEHLRKEVARLEAGRSPEAQLAGDERQDLLRLRADAGRVAILIAERDSAVRERDAAAAKLVAALDEVRRLRGEVEQQVASHRRDTEGTAKRVQVAEARVTTLEHDNRLLKVAEGEARRKAEELLAAKKEASDLRMRTDAADKRQVEARKEVVDLSARLEAAEKRSAEALSVARKEASELRLRVEMAEQRVSGAEGVREELIRLRETGQLATTLAADLAAAQAEVRTLQARAHLAEGRAAEVDRLRDENHALRDEQQRSSEAAREMVATQGELRDARLRLQVAESRAQESEVLRDENRGLRTELDDLSDAKIAVGELTALREQYRQLRLEADLLARRVDELSHHGTEAAELRDKVHALSSGEQDGLRARLQALEAQLFALGKTPAAPRSHGVEGETHGRAPAAGNFGLEALVAMEPIRVAVLADTRGLLIAGAGDRDHQEGLAALGSLASGLALRAREYLPLAEVRCVQLSALDDVTFACWLFGNNEFALSTVGSGAAPQDAIDRVINAASADLAS